MKQKIADGVVQWVRDEAPVSVKMVMTPEMVRQLVQAICDQFDVEDFDEVAEDA